jgi:tetratricopeptide (TPR) repeat protein
LLYKNLGALTLRTGQYKKADAALTRWAELAPSDPEPLLALAEARERLKRPQDAATLTERAIGLRQASGQPVPEGWYKRGLKHTFDASLAPQSFKIGRDLVATYPSPQNWRDTLLIYSDLAKPDAASKIDVMRLMRAAKALNGERDYLEFAQALSAAGLHGEAKEVLDEGVAAKMVDPAKATFKELIGTSRTRAAAGKAPLKSLETKALAAAAGEPALAAGDALLGYGEHVRAAALYRAAVQKGAAQADVANLRLGTALALGGQRAEAEAAFRSVTGPRAELASLWLAWLGQRG